MRVGIEVKRVSNGWLLEWWAEAGSAPHGAQIEVFTDDLTGHKQEMDDLLNRVVDIIDEYLLSER